MHLLITMVSVKVNRLITSCLAPHYAILETFPLKKHSAVVHNYP